MASRLPTIRTLRIQIITWDNVISSFHKNKVWHDRKLWDDKSYDSAAPLKHCLSNSNYRHTMYYAIAREICSVFSEFMIWSTFFFSYFNASSNIVASCYSFQWYIQYHDPWSFHCHMQYAVNTFAKSGHKVWWWSSWLYEGVGLIRCSLVLSLHFGILLPNYEIMLDLSSKNLLFHVTFLYVVLFL